MASESKEMFSKKALERLRSPDRLDTLFTNTTPVGWLALTAVLLLIASGIIWSLFGVMATKVNGYGVIVDSGGAASITHQAGGRVLALNVDTGDRVEKGQVVALVEQPALEQQIAKLKAELTAATSRQDMNSKVAELNSLTEKLARDREVISPFAGIIVEQKVNSGDYVQPGAGLYGIRLDQERGDVIAILYVPVLEGKKIKPGMLVQIAPGSVDASEYGTLTGRVNTISDYPVSSEGVNSWVSNKELTTWLLQKNGGAAVEVRAELIRDPETVTGYLWSSVMGAPEVITPGTVCTGSIVVKRQPPLSKAFLKLNQWLRSD